MAVKCIESNNQVFFWNNYVFVNNVWITAILSAGEARPRGNSPVSELPPYCRKIKHWRHQGETTSADGYDWRFRWGFLMINLDQISDIYVYICIIHALFVYIVFWPLFVFYMRLYELWEQFIDLVRNPNYYVVSLFTMKLFFVFLL